MYLKKNVKVLRTKKKKKEAKEKIYDTHGDNASHN